MPDLLYSCVLAANATQISQTQFFFEKQKVFSKKATFKGLWCYIGLSMCSLGDLGVQDEFFLEGKVLFWSAHTFSPLKSR